MFIEKGLKPKIIGKNGQTIKRVQAHTETRIVPFSDFLEKIEIKGNDISVNDAIEEIRSK